MQRCCVTVWEVAGPRNGGNTNENYLLLTVIQQWEWMKCFSWSRSFIGGCRPLEESSKILCLFLAGLIVSFKLRRSTLQTMANRQLSQRSMTPSLSLCPWESHWIQLSNPTLKNPNTSKNFTCSCQILGGMSPRFASFANRCQHSFGRLK